VQKYNKPQPSPETPKKKLPPELQKLHDDGFAKLQAKLKAGEPVYESDYEFVAKLEAYLKPLVAIEKLKEVMDIKKQYQDRLETLTTFEFIESPKNPVITGIDNKKYPAPTLEQIMAKITPEKAALIEKYIKNPTLLLVPFAMPLKTIAKKAGQKKGKLEQKPVYTDNWDVDSDLPDRAEDKEQLIYFPEKYVKTDHGGLTKSEILGTEGGPNAFPGWQVLIVDGTETTLEDTLNKSAIDLKKEFDEAGLSGLTPEEWLLLHAEGALKGTPFDDYSKDSFTWNLDSYLTSGDVPDSYWSPGGSQAGLSWNEPDNSNENLGSRRSVRIY
jgi:hypothetical protein